MSYWQARWLRRTLAPHASAGEQSKRRKIDKFEISKCDLDTCKAVRNYSTIV
jgi:hypothetical protein